MTNGKFIQRQKKPLGLSEWIIKKKKRTIKDNVIINAPDEDYSRTETRTSAEREGIWNWRRQGWTGDRLNAYGDGRRRSYCAHRSKRNHWKKRDRWHTRASKTVNGRKGQRPNVSNAVTCMRRERQQDGPHNRQTNVIGFYRYDNDDARRQTQMRDLNVADVESRPTDYGTQNQKQTVE